MRLSALVTILLLGGLSGICQALSVVHPADDELPPPRHPLTTPGLSDSFRVVVVSLKSFVSGVAADLKIEVHAPDGSLYDKGDLLVDVMLSNESSTLFSMPTTTDIPVESNGTATVERVVIHSFTPHAIKCDLEFHLKQESTSKAMGLATVTVSVTKDDTLPKMILVPTDITDHTLVDLSVTVSRKLLDTRSSAPKYVSLTMKTAMETKCELVMDDFSVAVSRDTATAIFPGAFLKLLSTVNDVVQCEIDVTLIEAVSRTVLSSVTQSVTVTLHKPLVANYDFKLSLPDVIHSQSDVDIDVTVTVAQAPPPVEPGQTYEIQMGTIRGDPLSSCTMKSAGSAIAPLDPTTGHVLVPHLSFEPDNAQVKYCLLKTTLSEKRDQQTTTPQNSVVLDMNIKYVAIKVEPPTPKPSAHIQIQPLESFTSGFPTNIIAQVTLDTSLSSPKSSLLLSIEIEENETRCSFPDDVPPRPAHISDEGVASFDNVVIAVVHAIDQAEADIPCAVRFTLTSTVLQETLTTITHTFTVTYFHETILTKPAFKITERKLASLLLYWIEDGNYIGRPQHQQYMQLTVAEDSMDVCSLAMPAETVKIQYTGQAIFHDVYAKLLSDKTETVVVCDLTAIILDEEPMQQVWSTTVSLSIEPSDVSHTALAFDVVSPASFVTKSPADLSLRALHNGEPLTPVANVTYKMLVSQAILDHNMSCTTDSTGFNTELDLGPDGITKVPQVTVWPTNEYTTFCGLLLSVFQYDMHTGSSRDEEKSKVLVDCAVVTVHIAEAHPSSEYLIALKSTLPAALKNGDATDITMIITKDGSSLDLTTGFDVELSETPDDHGQCTIPQVPLHAKVFADGSATFSKVQFTLDDPAESDGISAKHDDTGDVVCGFQVKLRMSSPDSKGSDALLLSTFTDSVQLQAVSHNVAGKVVLGFIIAILVIVVVIGGIFYRVRRRRAQYVSLNSVDSGISWHNQLDPTSS